MPSSTPLALVVRVLQILLGLAAVSALLALLWNHYQLVSYPTLLDYYEGGMQAITRTMASGSNPYASENQPSGMSVYPPLYNMVAAPFSMIFENTLVLHRLIAGIFILLSASLCYWASYRLNRSIIASLCTAGLVYAGLLFYSTPISSPNSVGLFFFLLSVLIPWYHNFTLRSLIFSGAAGILAFYGKQYFLAGLGYVALYVFLFESKKRGVVFGVVSALALIGSLWVVQFFGPHFINDTIVAVRSATGVISNNLTLLEQLSQFVTTYLGLFVLLAVVVLITAGRFLNEVQRDAPVREKASSAINLNIDGPLLNRRLDYAWFCFLCSLLIILVIGRNPGNHMTYLFQFLSPFFLIGSFSIVTHQLSMKWLSPPFIAYCLYVNVTMLPWDFSADTASWSRLGKNLVGKQQVYGSPIVLPFLIENKATIYNNGHSPYFIFSGEIPPWLNIGEAEKTNTSLWKDYVVDIREKIETRHFELIVLDQWTRVPELSRDLAGEVSSAELLKKHYKLKRKIPLVLADRLGAGKYNLQIWEPR